MSIFKKFILISLVSISSSSYAHISDPDIQQALLNIYDQTGGFAWTNSYGWSLKGPIACSAYGITCDGDGNLVGLRLANNGLMGHMPPNIDGLYMLDFIHLSIESYSGMAPINIHYP